MGELALKFDGTPIRSKRGLVGGEDRHRRQVLVRFDACQWGEIQAFERLTRFTKSEICRRGVGLLTTGYPVLSPEVQAWLSRMATANDMHGDPQAVLTAVLEQLAASYPAGRRLRPS